MENFLSPRPPRQPHRVENRSAPRALRRWGVALALVTTASGFAPGCSPSSPSGEPVDDQLRLLSGPPFSDPAGGPNDFLQFVNQQRSVPSGDYTAFVAPSAASGADFELRVTAQDAAAELRSATACPASLSPARRAAGRCYAVRQQVPGGMQLSVSPDGDYDIQLLDRDGRALSAALIERPAQHRFSALRSRTDNTHYAEAYYNAVDPSRSRRRLPDWQQANGFGRDGSGCDAHVVFRDVRDLGYGRNMCMRQNPDGSVAVWVRNYLVSVDLPGDADPAQYGNALSLDAAIDENSRFHLGTNAIEFSRHPRPQDDADAPPFLKFFTFAADGELDTAPNLDGRGAHAMPGICIVCHNGAARTLVSSTASIAVSHIERAIRDGGDVNAKFQPLDVPDLGYSSRAGFTRADLEAGIKRINVAIYCTYPGTLDAPVCQRADPVSGETLSMGQPAAVPGDWDGELMKELLAGWYGGGDFPSPTYVPNFVPAGWIGDDSLQAPEATRNLFLRVVGPHCIVCHGSRGQTWNRDRTAVDFSSYQSFLGYEEQIVAYVFDLGIMPLSRLNYQTLFADEPALETLAAALPSYANKYADAAQLVRPGAPLADAGPNRHVNVSRVTLFGGSSRYADSYRWRLLESQGASASLRMAGQMNAALTANGAGRYVVELVVSRNGVESRPSTAAVVIDATPGPEPAALRFYPHIRDVLQQRLGAAPACVQCHTGEPAVPADSYPQIPVWYTDEQPEGQTLYEATLEFVDFRNVRWSDILQRGTGYNHIGGQQAGFDLSAGGDASRYHMLVNWILHGALEGEAR